MTGNSTPARIRLVRVRQDLPAVAKAIRDRTEICLVAHYPGKAIGPFDRLFGPGESLLCEERRGQPIARGTADDDALRHAAEALDRPGRLRRSVADSPDHSLKVQSEQPAGSGRRTEHPTSRGDVPAAPVVRRRNRKTDPAFGFDAED
jgi:hypothetical protein